MRPSTNHSTPIRTLQVVATATALLFASAPAAAQSPPAPAPEPVAAPEAPAPDAPASEAPAPEAPAPDAPATDAPAADAPAGDAPAGDPGAWDPTGAQAPEAAPAEPAPVAAPPPEPVGPAPAPEATVAPVDPAKARSLRNAGTGTMIAGGVISLVGFGMTVGFTLRGTKLENELIAAEERYQLNECGREESSMCNDLTADRDSIRDGIIRADRMTMIAGGVLAGGLLVTAIGGIVYRVGIRRLTNADMARVRVSPSFGGLTISGRF